MEFRIADTFTDSLGRLTGKEQTSAKTTAFDLQMNPASPGMRLHKLDRAKDKNFWSVRVSGDIRIIVHKTAGSLMLCYVDHHDDAYEWAGRRKLETHPKTGAAQLVEVRETVKEITVPKYVEVEQPVPPKPLLFAEMSDDELLSYGVPLEWLDDARQANEDTLLELADHLPQIAEPVPADTNPFEHPDAQRRFRVMTNVEELERALNYPWEKWTVFLHPAQRDLVERNYNGPARVSGSAGTGKTVVALHRAAYLARTSPKARILLTTFSITLARNLRQKLGRLIGDSPELQDRIAVRAIDEVGLELYESAFGKPKVPTPSMLRAMLKAASESGESHRFSMRFIESEWNDVVDAWQLGTWEAYRDVARLGRKTRLGEKQRALLWSIFERVRSDLNERGLVTIPMVFASATEGVGSGKMSPADFVVIDEAQDISVPQIQFLAALAGHKENGLFFAGDLGQRIFQTPFSWKSLGVDIRGRSRTLGINYRTSHQIRRQADRLLPPELSDVDGNTEERRGTISVFNGPEPLIEICDTEDQETRTVAQWLAKRQKEQVQPHEIGVFVRSESQIPRARRAIEAAGLGIIELDGNVEAGTGQVSISTMHLAKGLEFRAVVVMACDDEIIPLQERIEAVADDADLEDVYNTERHLLYVACTRARDHLLVTSVEPASEFLDDLRA